MNSSFLLDSRLVDLSTEISDLDLRILLPWSDPTEGLRRREPPPGDDLVDASLGMRSRPIARLRPDDLVDGTVGMRSRPIARLRPDDLVIRSAGECKDIDGMGSATTNSSFLLDSCSVDMSTEISDPELRILLPCSCPMGGLWRREPPPDDDLIDGSLGMRSRPIARLRMDALVQADLTESGSSLVSTTLRWLRPGLEWMRRNPFFLDFDGMKSSFVMKSCWINLSTEKSDLDLRSLLPCSSPAEGLWPRELRDDVLVEGSLGMRSRPIARLERPDDLVIRSVGECKDIDDGMGSATMNSSFLLDSCSVDMSKEMSDPDLRILLPCSCPTGGLWRRELRDDDVVDGSSGTRSRPIARLRLDLLRADLTESGSSLVSLILRWLRPGLDLVRRKPFFLVRAIAFSSTKENKSRSARETSTLADIEAVSGLNEDRRLSLRVDGVVGTLSENRGLPLRVDGVVGTLSENRGLPLDVGVGRGSRR
jgi:hypothetical protein